MTSARLHRGRTLGRVLVVAGFTSLIINRSFSLVRYTMLVKFREVVEGGLLRPRPGSTRVEIEQ